MTRVIDMLDAHMRARPPKFAPGSRDLVGASEIGCERQAGFRRLERNPASGAVRNTDALERWGATERGNLIERFVMTAMRERYRADLLYALEQQQTFRHGPISATPDGLLIDQPLDHLQHLGVTSTEAAAVVYEIKSVDPRSNLHGEARTEHAAQAQVQLGLLRLLTEHKPAWAVIVYIDASFLDKVEEYAVRFDPEAFASLTARARRILAAKHIIELRPMGAIQGGRLCGFCEYSAACQALRRNMPPDALAAERAGYGNAALVNELTRLALEVEDLRLDAHAAHGLASDAEEHLVAVMRKNGIGHFESNGVSVVVSAYERAGAPTERLTIRISGEARRQYLIGAKTPTAQ
jgi:hypothetical protein